MKDCFRSIQTAINNCRIKQKIQQMFPGTVIEQHVVIKGNLKNLRFGRGVVIQSGTVLHLGGMEWCQNEGWLEIGDDSVISPNCVIYGCGSGGVHIGKRFDCGPGVGIFSSRTDYMLEFNNHIFAPVIIGDNVIIYANSVISPGVLIGNDAVIAACSVVTSDIPANCFAAGSPAQIIKRNLRKK